MDSKWREDLLDRICWSGAIAFTASVVISVVVSVIETVVYDVKELHDITYIILFSVLFVILWVLLLSKLSSDYVARVYKLRTKAYREQYSEIMNNYYYFNSEIPDFDYDRDKEDEDVDECDYNVSIDDIDLSDEVRDKLKEMGITTMADVCKYSVKDMADAVGKDGIRELLKAFGDISGNNFFKEFGVRDGESESREQVQSKA